MWLVIRLSCLSPLIPVPQSGINSVIANNDENVTIEVPVSGNVFKTIKIRRVMRSVTAVTGSTPGVSFTVSGTDRTVIL